MNNKENSKDLMFGKIIIGHTENRKPKTAPVYFDFNDVHQISFAPYSETEFQYGALVKFRDQKHMRTVFISKNTYKYFEEKFWGMIK